MTVLNTCLKKNNVLYLLHIGLTVIECLTKQDNLVVTKCNTTFVLYSFKRIYKQFYSNIHLEKDSKSNGSTYKRVWQFGKF